MDKKVSLYAQFIKEISTDSIIENDEGFVTYRYLNDGYSVYMIDVYVVPSARIKGIFLDFVDQIIKEAKSKGCKEILGTISMSNPNRTAIMRGHMAYGMQLSAISQDAIILRKDI